MKRLLLLLLLLPSLVFADVDTSDGFSITTDTTIDGFAVGTADGFTVKSGITAYCNSCPDADNGADLLCETFDATGYDCGTDWTESVDTGTINEDQSVAGDWICTDSNTYSLRLAHPAGSYTYVEADFGMEYEEFFGTFYFKLISDNMTSGSQIPLMHALNQYGQNSWRIDLRRDTTGAFLMVRMDTDSSYTEVDVGNGSTPDYITSGTSGDVIRVRFSVDTTDGTGTSEFKIRIGEGGTERTISFNEDDTGDDSDTQYWRFGIDASYGEGYTIEVDFIRFDATALPGICAGDS